ncbi:molybdopterin molybdotransferase MoeA [Streptomyces sp. NPDC004134]|uniref:molybdopterin molybdotransferase MoeA n=1 Tax=Streptomyces sp. NPDC004134 TaxID=3364691 RepID=UPI00368B953F
MTSGRRGDRRTQGSGAGAGSGNGSDGETGARGDEFADALALANDRRDLAAAYGDAFTLADPPPPAAPARPGTSRERACTDEFGDDRAPSGSDSSPRDRGDGFVAPSARTGPGSRAEGRGTGGGRGAAPGSGPGPRGRRGGPGAGDGPAAPGSGAGSGRRSGRAMRQGPDRTPRERGGDATGSGRGGDPLDVALGLDGRARREPRDPRGLSWDAARRVAVRSGRRLGAVAVPVAGAYGQVLAEPLRALADLPPFDTSAMDGYAVAGPGPWRLDAAGQGILAGHAAHPALPDGHAVRIATGARVPPGATGVLRSEHAGLRDDGSLYATGATAAQDVRTGQDIRPRGQECRAGVELLPAGERVTPAVLGLAAAAGHDELRVVRRPRVEVLVLGAELLHRGLPREGRIRDALGPMLEPWLRACGAEPFVTRRLGDDAELLYEAVATSTADVVVTTGGTAAGPVDHVHGTLRRLKADLVVDGVAVRPGHPMLLAVLPTGAHVVGLPGNPLAAVSGLLTLAEPLLRVLGGAPVPEPPEAVLTADAKGHPTDTRLVPVAMEHGGAHAPAAHRPARTERSAPDAPTAQIPPPSAQRPARTPARSAHAAPVRAAASGAPYPAARPLHFTGPAMLRGLAAADALAVVPPGGAPAGAPVRVLRLPWAAASAAATAPAGPA